MPRRTFALLLALLLTLFPAAMPRLLPCAAAAEADASAAAPSFRNDVLPILTKAGCNGGGCHGALAGKGGFRLSLFGYNPDADWHAITREALGRRTDLANPGASLFLTKPTAAVKHKGGKRIQPDSVDYRTLAAWIAAGAPAPKAGDPAVRALRLTPPQATAAVGAAFALKVTAEFTDGTQRDVTRWTKFTSTDEAVAEVDASGNVKLIGSGPGAVTAWYSSRVAIAPLTVPFPYHIPPDAIAAESQAHPIDALILENLAALRLKPSPLADDATFLRRAMLDTIGRLPTAQEIRAFLADPSTDKYRSLAERLLQRPEFIDYWTYKWCDILLVNGSKLRPSAVKAYYDWIRARVADNTPWDQFARQIVTSAGSSIDNGATNFFAVHQDPESMAENVSQAFLSLSINCARCHNHPLEKWTNDQYYAFANLFSRVRAKGWGGDSRSGSGIRTLYVLAEGDLIQPRTGKPQPPAPLDAPPLPPADTADRRAALAQWLTAPENPYFARAIANRIWANFLGAGLVEPVDDLRVSNPASNEKLLAALADHLTAQHYDVRSLIRLILTSHAYRRSSAPLPENAGDRRSFARYYPRRLPAEVLSDAIADITGVPDSYSEIALNDGSSEKTDAYKAGTRALQLYDSAVRSYFLQTFGRNQREITCECERSSQPSLVQALHLANGATLNQKLAASEGTVTKLLASQQSPGQIVTEACLLCLGRPPNATELQQYTETLAAAPEQEKRAAVEDLFWSLLTSRHFLFQH